MSINITEFMIRFLPFPRQVFTGPENLRGTPFCSPDLYKVRIPWVFPCILLSVTLLGAGSFNVKASLFFSITVLAILLCIGLLSFGEQAKRHFSFHPQDGRILKLLAAAGGLSLLTTTAPMLKWGVLFSGLWIVLIAFICFAGHLVLGSLCAIEACFTPRHTGNGFNNACGSDLASSLSLDRALFRLFCLVAGLLVITHALFFPNEHWLILLATCLSLTQVLSRMYYENTRELFSTWEIGASLSKEMDPRAAHRRTG